jgi:GDPmannose 4,6-dehydratase
MKTAVIFGVNGQDGSHLADFLLDKGYKVVGVKRRSSTNNDTNIRHLRGVDNFSVVEADITDYSSLVCLFKTIENVDEVYNLAAQSHVGTSFKQPGLTWDITGKGCMNILQVLVDLDLLKVKFYQASSSEMFGASYDEKLLPYAIPNYGRIPEGSPSLVKQGIADGVKKYQDENTKHLPQSPYAIAKCAAHMSVRLYREAYGIHASAGILFNHEGPRRGENFVTRKITKWIGEYKAWEKEVCNDDNVIISCCPDEGVIKAHIGRFYISNFPMLRLGNVETKRDWGHAKDYVRAMWMMLQQEEPDDYVICTEETRTVKDFLSTAFGYAGLDNWENYVVIDPEFYRPAEVDFLLGSCEKAKNVLGWIRKYSFDDLVKEMVDNDISRRVKNV